VQGNRRTAAFLQKRFCKLSPQLNGNPHLREKTRRKLSEESFLRAVLRVAAAERLKVFAGLWETVPADYARADIY
jgi:hypothetical protein